jgi:hypothetical protein
MVKINIKNNLGVITHSGTFVTQQEANQWISLNADSGAWGKPQRSLYVEFGKTLADFGEVESDVLSFTESGYLGQTSKTYVLKQAFLIESEDVTAQIAQQKKVQANLKRMAFGNILMAELAASNQDDIELGALTVAQVVEAEASLATVQRLLMNGSLGLAINLLQNSVIPHMSESKKAFFLLKMTSYMEKESTSGQLHDN